MNFLTPDSTPLALPWFELTASVHHFPAQGVLAKPGALGLSCIRASEARSKAI